jgi:peptidyl-prolyl cis-trans isomerase D
MSELKQKTAQLLAIEKLFEQHVYPRVAITEEELRDYYEANKDRLAEPEQVRAAQIVVKGLDEAKRIQVQLQQGKKFADLARKYSLSADAKVGGDLGFFPRGVMPEKFDLVAFNLKEGQISDVVESEFGFHIIQLTGVRKQEGKEERRASHILIPAPADAKPFEAMREQVEAELKKVRVQRRFSEAADAFQNVVYEQPESLKPAAERFKLKIQTSDWLTRSGGEERGPLENRKLLAALFSSDALRSKRNTDAIEVAPGTLIAARVIEHQPAAQRKLEEVKDDIGALLQRQEASGLARKDGEAKLEQLRKGAGAGVKWSPPKTVSRRETQNLPGEVLRPVMSADASKLPAYIGLPVADAGYMLVRVSKVMEGDPKQGGDPVPRAAGLAGAAQFQAYVASLRKQADISLNQANLEKKQ